MGIKGAKWVVKTGIPNDNANQRHVKGHSYEERKYEEHRVHTSEKKILEAIQESQRCDEWN